MGKNSTPVVEDTPVVEATPVVEDTPVSLESVLEEPLEYVNRTLSNFEHALSLHNVTFKSQIESRLNDIKHYLSLQ